METNQSIKGISDYGEPIFLTRKESTSNKFLLYVNDSEEINNQSIVVIRQDYLFKDGAAHVVDQLPLYIKKVKETDESYYHADGVNGRIYVEIAHDESGEPVKRLTKYLEIDGVMYRDTGMGSRGSAGVFAYSKISAMSDDEIIFTYPIRQDLTDELILTGIAEGRLVQEDGTWKFGWFMGEDNVTDKYNDLWYA